MLYCLLMSLAVSVDNDLMESLCLRSFPLWLSFQSMNPLSTRPVLKGELGTMFGDFFEMGENLSFLSASVVYFSGVSL